MGTSKIVRDPVCGASIEEAAATGHTDFSGHTLYFCSPACKAKFDDDPAEFLDDPVVGEAAKGGHGCVGPLGTSWSEYSGEKKK